MLRLLHSCTTGGAQKAPGPARSALILVWFALSGVSYSADLSLPEALRLALRENSSIEYHHLGTVIADRQLDYEKSIYTPNASLSTRYETQPWDPDSSGNNPKEAAEAVFSLAKRHSLGGEVSMNLSAYGEQWEGLAADAESEFYSTRLYLRGEQPLLRGAGPRVANLEIYQARLRADLAAETFAALLNEILSDVFTAYADLFHASRSLRVTQDIRKKMEAIHDIVAEKTELRKLPITDLDTMKVSLGILDSDILEMERVVRARRSTLMLAVFNNTTQQTDVAFVPITSPGDLIRAFPRPEFSETLAKAREKDLALLTHHMELLVLEEDIHKAGNDVKPDLTLATEVGVEGHAVEDWSTSMGDISGKNVRFLVSGALALPMSTRAARSRLAELRAKRRQLRILIANRKGRMEYVVQELFRDIETQGKKMALNEEIVSLSRKNLENEMQRLVAEKSTVLDMLRYQTELADAELDMLGTLTKYMRLIGAYYALRGEMALFAVEGGGLVLSR